MKKYMIALYIRLSLEGAKTDSMNISSQDGICQGYFRLTHIFLWICG